MRPAYGEQGAEVGDHLLQAVVGRLVLAQLPRIRHSHRLPPARRRSGCAARGARSGAVLRALIARRGRQVEERRRQAHGQVARRHLIDRRQGGHVGEERQERLQRLAVLVGQQQHGAAQRLQALVHRHNYNLKNSLIKHFNHSNFNFEL